MLAVKLYKKSKSSYAIAVITFLALKKSSSHNKIS